MGASWGAHCAICTRSSVDPEATSFKELRGIAQTSGSIRLLTASAGNHGHAIARFARWLSIPSTILVPAATNPQRVAAIANEGADVMLVDGTYEDAVAQARDLESATMLLVSDTAWPGYEAIPARVIEGYETIHLEVEEQLAHTQLPQPDVAFVPVGVGAFCASVARHPSRTAARIIAVEPEVACCLAESLKAGSIVDINAGRSTSMQGLNAGKLSIVAWPDLRAHVLTSVVIDDGVASRGSDLLFEEGVRSGPCGGASVGGALALLEDDDGRELMPDTVALFYVTEGPH
jgi:diaminopropionate ammonia-lyase